MIPEITLQQARAIVSLAYILDDHFDYTEQDMLVGVPIDGVVALEGVVHARYITHGDVNKHRMGEHYPSLVDRVEYLAASSSGEHRGIDMEQFNKIKTKLKALGFGRNTLIFIDWRTKTGTLGQMLKEIAPDCIYAVVSDPNCKADLRGTTEDIPKVAFSTHEDAMKCLGLFIGRQHSLEGEPVGPITYKYGETPDCEEFYARLFAKINEVIEKDKDPGSSYVA